VIFDVVISKRRHLYALQELSNLKKLIRNTTMETHVHKEVSIAILRDIWW
jgi:hypothetical protein